MYLDNIIIYGKSWDKYKQSEYYTSVPEQTLPKSVDLEWRTGCTLGTEWVKEVYDQKSKVQAVENGKTAYQERN